MRKFDAAPGRDADWTGHEDYQPCPVAAELLAFEKPEYRPSPAALRIIAGLEEAISSGAWDERVAFTVDRRQSVPPARVDHPVLRRLLRR